MDPEEFSPVETEFQKRLMDNPNFREALMVACENSRGKLWLIGGSVFRTLANIMYGTPIPDKTDFDFVVEELEKTAVCREKDGWRLELNHYKNPKLIKGDLSVDLVPLATVHSIVRRGCEPTIENFLTGTPLNIQSVVYDCARRQIMGEIGIKALQTKTVAVNDPIQATYHAERKNTTVAELLKKYASELHFAYEDPDWMG